jgi:hypothetical protein
MQGDPMQHHTTTVATRQFGRRHTRLHAIIEARGRSSVRCIARNVSAAGAVLEVAQASSLPTRFTLVIEATKFVYQCEVTQRAENTVDVRFPIS